MKTNTLKKLMLGLLAAGLLLALGWTAQPVARADTGSEGVPQAALDAQRAHMWQMRDVMHGAAFVATPTQDGVTVQVTSPDAALTTTIRDEFGPNHVPISPLADSTVTAEEITDGVALTFTSTDPAVVAQLQGYGAGLAYTMLRNSMHATMIALGAAGGYGPGMMGGTGYGPGAGYGPGSGPGAGYGRGMMGGGWMHGGPGYGPGPGNGYGPGNGPGPGYGRGMMGGYGPGWMHGPGYGPSATPPAPGDSK
jgi:hypothetical protein